MTAPAAVVGVRDIERRLSRVDWSFPGAGTRPSSVHSLHWFPGNFIAPIPRALIEILSEPGDLVVDPFCGSGTTAAEALLLGRRAWQSDVNRASVQVSSGKSALLCSPKTVSSQLLDFGRTLEELKLVGHRRPVKIETDPELHFWYHSDTLRQLRLIFSEIVFTSGPLRAVLDMLFSDLLFACANSGRSRTSSGGLRRHHWGWVADNVRPADLVPHAAIEMLQDRIQMAIVAKEGADEVRPTPMGCLYTARADARYLPLSDSVGHLIVTSPPYFSTIDYTMASRLVYLWYGWSLKDERTGEIGARFKRFRKAALVDYLSAMEVCVSEIYRVLRPGGYCAIVIGSSRNHPSAATAVIRMFGDCFDLSWGPVERVLSRMRVSRGGTAGREMICVFQRPW